MKMFRNCPEEVRNYCEGCVRFKKCKLKQAKRKIKRIKKKIIVMVIILTLTCLLMPKLKCGEEKQVISYNVDVTIVTPQAIEENKVATSSAIKVNATKSPIITKKRKRKKIKITQEEKKLLEKVVFAEARGECFRGQVAVAAVVFNRYEFNKGKISVKDIILAKNQFANISNITKEMLDEYPDCRRAVRKAIKGYDPTKVKFKEGARYFYEPALVSEYQRKIRKGVKTLKIGNHYFHNDFNE